jgi:hypothetical protein
MRNDILIAAVALLMGGTALVAGQRGVTRVNPLVGAVRFAEAYRPANSSGNTRVVGSVIDIRQAPVAYAKVHLRDLTTGNVLIERDANDRGEYAFDELEPGTYVVEMVMVDGYVVALSNAGALAKFDTLQTVVQLPGRWDAGNRRMTMPQDAASFFGMSAQNTMSAQTIEMAIEQSIQPLDAGEPVSPTQP